MSNNNEILLSVRNIVVEYTSGKDIVYAVNGVSFDLKKGKTLGLVGESGAGKTTIAKAILRLLPNPPAKFKSGEIIFNGQDIVKLNEKEILKIRGSKIAMIFQDPMTALNPIMRVGDQIAEALLLHNKGMTIKEAAQKSCEMLETVGIPRDRTPEFPFQFSGGMKQRIVIANALSCSPELLLADEPTTALDVTIQAQVLDKINELKEMFNTSMVLITHDLGVVAHTCDDVAVVYAGEIVEYAEKIELYDNPKHPYTLGLFGSLPSMNSNTKRLTPINGLPPDPTRLPHGCAFYPRCPKAISECEYSKIPLVEVTEGHFCRCLCCKDGKDPGDRSLDEIKRYEHRHDSHHTHMKENPTWQR